MRTQITEQCVKLWLSANETYLWAQNMADFAHNTRWHCSQLSGKRLFAEFDRNGLCDLAINGKTDSDCDCTELSAVCADYLSKKLPKDHACYFIAVGQFKA